MAHKRFVVRDSGGNVHLISAEGATEKDGKAEAEAHAAALELQQPEETYTVEDFKA